MFPPTPPSFSCLPETGGIFQPHLPIDLIWQHFSQPSASDPVDPAALRTTAGEQVGAQESAESSHRRGENEWGPSQIQRYRKSDWAGGWRRMALAGLNVEGTGRAQPAAKACGRLSHDSQCARTLESNRIPTWCVRMLGRGLNLAAALGRQAALPGSRGFSFYPRSSPLYPPALNMQGTQYDLPSFHTLAG